MQEWQHECLAAAAAGARPPPPRDATTPARPRDVLHALDEALSVASPAAVAAVGQARAQALMLSTHALGSHLSADGCTLALPHMARSRSL